MDVLMLFLRDKVNDAVGDFCSFNVYWFSSFVMLWKYWCRYAISNQTWNFLEVTYAMVIIAFSF